MLDVMNGDATPWDELFDADAAHALGPDKLPLRAHYRVTLGGYIGFWPTSRYGVTS